MSETQHHAQRSDESWHQHLSNPSKNIVRPGHRVGANLLKSEKAHLAIVGEPTIETRVVNPV